LAPEKSIVAVLLELLIDRPVAPVTGLTVIVRLAVRQVFAGKVIGKVSPLLTYVDCSSRITLLVIPFEVLNAAIAAVRVA
jgi:hypothetical protein